MIKTKNVIILIEPVGFPSLASEYINNKRYVEMKHIICDVRKNKDNLIIIAPRFNTESKNLKLNDLKIMAEENDMKWFSYHPYTNPNIDIIKQFVKKSHNFIFDKDNSNIILGGCNLSGCVIQGLNLSAVTLAKAGYKTTIHLPLCAEYEQAGINDVETHIIAFYRMYNIIKDNNVNIDISYYSTKLGLEKA